MVDSDLGAPPESWEVADLDASMRPLMLSSAKKESNTSSANKNGNDQSELGDGSALDSAPSSGNLSGGMTEDLINSVDQFLREALQNPRERLSGELYFFKFFNRFISSWFF